MATIELTAGSFEYQDTGGSGPVVVLLHGLAMNGSLWRYVVSELGADHRCVIPTLPLGGHRQPMRADADLSPRGIAPGSRVPGSPCLRSGLGLKGKQYAPGVDGPDGEDRHE
jgi:pimeloyl-ACP methyl ester carboxylesterase